MHEVFLLDPGAAHGELILPALHTYVDFAFPPLMAELDSSDLLSAPVGREMVNGVATTKYRVDHTAKDGSRGQGFVWVSRSGILMRLEAEVTRAHGGKPLAITMILSHLQTGPQDPALFQVPQGYVALPADALGPLLGGKPG